MFFEETGEEHMSWSCGKMGDEKLATSADTQKVERK